MICIINKNKILSILLNNHSLRLIIMMILMAVIGFGCGSSSGGGGGTVVVKSEEVSTAEPAEIPLEIVRQQPDPLPEVWDKMRTGQWSHSINMPWDNYGTDFGSNYWGYRGLASQGPSGWRKDTSGSYQGARRLFWAQRNDNDYCMGVEVQIEGPSSDAIVYFLLDDPTRRATGESVDLRGETITAQVYFPSGSEGTENAPNGFVLFMQSGDNWEWAESQWINIVETGRWLTISVPVNNLVSRFPAFDPAKVHSIGLKMGSDAGADRSYSYEGNFYIDNVSTPSSPDIQFRFSSPETRTEQEIGDIAKLKATGLRWWLFSDGRTGLKFNANGSVSGLDDEFINDLDELIYMARSNGIYLVPVLFDYLLGAEPQYVDGVQLYGHSDLINDPIKRKSLLDNAISIIFDKFGNVPEIAAWELMNEPEWLLTMDIPQGKRPAQIRSGGVVSPETMKIFFSEIMNLYNKKGLGKQLFTVGSASPKWATLWQDLNLDVAQFHLWNAKGQIDEGLKFDFAPPVAGVPNIIGEFSTQPGMFSYNVCQYVESAYDLGYSGAWPWAYRAKDNASLSQLGSEGSSCILSFANDHLMDIVF